jgi:hypothetical protein
VLILNTNAGLWGYNIGDTVEFTSLKPYRIIVTGRIKHFTSAFGEHVIAKEVECALKEAVQQHPEVKITEFTVAPKIKPEQGLPYHQWLIEFATEPKSMNVFEADIDKSLQKQNSYYKDLIDGKILKQLEVSVLQTGAFTSYMKTQGKLGGQNKVPRLANDRKIAQHLKLKHFK